MSPYPARLRPELYPRQPLLGNDTHHIRQMLPAFYWPFLDFDSSEIILAAHATARRYLVERQPTVAGAMKLISDNPRVRPLAFDQGAHRAGGIGQVEASARRRRTDFSRSGDR